VAIRAEVGRRIVLKDLPKFEYILDHSAARGARILQVLDEVTPPAATPAAAPAPEPKE
jgi:ribosome-binding factor A